MEQVGVVVAVDPQAGVATLDHVDEQVEIHEMFGVGLERHVNFAELRAIGQSLQIELHVGERQPVEIAR